MLTINRKGSIGWIAAGLLALGIVGGCTWVQPEDGAEEVRLVEKRHVEGCQRLGSTTTEVRDRVAAVQRRPGKVEEELDTLAKNSAAEAGGDTLVATSDVRDGRRTYDIYRC